MVKRIKSYNRPMIKVNDFISRHHLMGWELGDGSTTEQLGHDEQQPGPITPGDPTFGVKKKNVWDMDE